MWISAAESLQSAESRARQADFSKAQLQTWSSPVATGRAGLRGGGRGGNCPWPSAPRGPPWWHLFVL